MKRTWIYNVATFRVVQMLTSTFLTNRVPQMSESTHNLTKRSGSKESRVSRTDYESESQENVTMRKVPRRSYTPSSRPSTSNPPRVYIRQLSKFKRIFLSNLSLKIMSFFCLSLHQSPRLSSCLGYLYIGPYHKHRLLETTIISYPFFLLTNFFKISYGVCRHISPTQNIFFDLQIIFAFWQHS